MIYWHQCIQTSVPNLSFLVLEIYNFAFNWFHHGKYVTIRNKYGSCKEITPVSLIIISCLSYEFERNIRSSHT